VIVGRAEPSNPVAAAKSSSTVEHELPCIRRRWRSPASSVCDVMRNAVFGASRVPGRPSRSHRSVHVSHSCFTGLSMAHDPAHNLLLKRGCCHFAQVIGVTSDPRITFPNLLKICASTQWLCGCPLLPERPLHHSLGGPITLVAPGSLRTYQRCRLHQTLVAPAAP
jgi:hypothetical protein